MRLSVCTVLVARYECMMVLCLLLSSFSQMGPRTLFGQIILNITRPKVFFSTAGFFYDFYENTHRTTI